MLAKSKDNGDENDLKFAHEGQFGAKASTKSYTRGSIMHSKMVVQQQKAKIKSDSKHSSEK